MNRNGFTFIETLVSLFVINTALVGAFAIITYNVNSGNFVKNSFIASGLAQEGMEVVRNLRDNEWFAAGTFGATLPAGSWRVQWNSTSLLPLDGNPPLQKDGSGSYGYDGGSPTLFSRKVTISPGISDDEIVVVVDVTWQERFGEQNISAEEHLFNWF